MLELFLAHCHLWVGVGKAPSMPAWMLLIACEDNGFLIPFLLQVERLPRIPQEDAPFSHLM